MQRSKKRSSELCIRPRSVTLYFFLMYNSIASNKRKTWALLIAFTILCTALFLVLGINLGMNYWQSIALGAGFSILYGSISYFFSDKVALFAAGATPIKKQDHFELYTMVENLAITAGLPTPKIYIINDPTPNAFATGRNPEHASVAYTTGILQILNKQELQGVTAHELSHIKNYDIRIMTIVVVLIGLVVLISDILLRVGLFGGGGRSRENNGQAAIAFLVIGLIAAILAPFIAQIIQLAVSRSREYLADASGAMLTRYPQGLASALQKIQQHAGKLQNANHATAHLYIANPFGGKNAHRGFFNRLFATHPPTEERIKRLLDAGR